MKKGFAPKDAFVLFLKVALVAGVFVWLAKKDLISLEAFRIGMTHLNRIVPGLLALVVSSVIAGFRWQMLLQAQDIFIPLARTYQLHYIGNFFNVTLPGAVSGDLVKAFYVAREVPGARAKAFGSILFDRLVGVSALVLVSVGALTIEYGTFQGSAVLAGVKAFVLVTGAGVVAFYSYLFLVRESHDPILRIFQALEAKNGKFGSLTRIYLGVRTYHHHRAVVLKALAASILIHLSAGFACIQFAYALQQTQLQPSEIYVVSPLGMLVTAVPVLPGGVGTGHAAFSFFFRLIDSQRGADVFSFFVIAQLLIGAFGGLLYLRFKANNPDIAAQLSQS